MAEFMGKDGFVWWQGVVEDRYDPLYLGRCKIRILGWHTEDKADMPTESLPWAYPIQPIISAAQTGVGISPTGPVEGTWVVGFYRDGEQAQEPVFFGTLGGIPELPSVPNVGFNDPRADFDLVNISPDVKKEKEAPRSLELDKENKLKNVPYPPKRMRHYKPFSQPSPDDQPSERSFISQKEGVVGSNDSSMYVEIEEYPLRSTYPRIDHLNEPTTPRAAIGKAQFKKNYALGIVSQKEANWGEMNGVSGFATASRQYKKEVVAGREVISAATPFNWTEPRPSSISNPIYPYNHVHESESGHLIEIDDTPGSERLHRYHRTGTYEEIGSLGQRIVKVVNENFHMGLNNDYTAIMGNKYENISGKLDIVSSGGYFHDVKSNIIDLRGSALNFSAGSAGNIEVTSEGVVIDAGSGTMTLRGQRLKKEFQDAAGTDKIRGAYTQEIGGTYSLESGSLVTSSRGSTGISSGGALDFVVTGALHETIANFSLPPALEARKTTATFGDINFNTANFGIGNFNVDIGPMFPGQPGGTGPLASFSMTPAGIITISSFMGVSGLFTMSPAGITLTYGASSISLTAAGVSIVGPTVSVGSAATVSTTVEGVLTSVKSSGITSVEGSLVKLN